MRLSTGLLLGVAAITATAAAVWTLWPSPSTGRADPNDARQVAFGALVKYLFFDHGGGKDDD